MQPSAWSLLTDVPKDTDAHAGLSGEKGGTGLEGGPDQSANADVDGWTCTSCHWQACVSSWPASSNPSLGHRLSTCVP